MKGYVVLVVLLIGGALVMYLGYVKGQNRYSYEIQTYDKFVPVPLLYDLYTGYAEDLGDNQIKATWNHLQPPENPSTPYFVCLGYIEPGPQPYYVLQIDNRIYLEKAEYIEPLIKALCALSRGGPEDNHPEDMQEVLACLPDDPDTLISLVKRFKKKP